MAVNNAAVSKQMEKMFQENTALNRLNRSGEEQVKNIGISTESHNKDKKTVRVGLYLTRELDKRIEKAAYEEDSTKSGIVESILRRYYGLENSTQNKIFKSEDD